MTVPSWHRRGAPDSKWHCRWAPGPEAEHARTPRTRPARTDDSSWPRTGQPPLHFDCTRSRRSGPFLCLWVYGFLRFRVSVGRRHSALPRHETTANHSDVSIALQVQVFPLNVTLDEFAQCDTEWLDLFIYLVGAISPPGQLQSRDGSTKHTSDKLAVSCSMAIGGLLQ